MKLLYPENEPRRIFVGDGSLRVGYFRSDRHTGPGIMKCDDQGIGDAMVEISGYAVVTFQRKPGCWRASISPLVDPRASEVGTKETLSFLTSEDCATEADAEKSARHAINNLTI